jgi:hypothetical protein
MSIIISIAPVVAVALIHLIHYVVKHCSWKVSVTVKSQSKKN